MRRLGIIAVIAVGAALVGARDSGSPIATRVTRDAKVPTTAVIAWHAGDEHTYDVSLAQTAKTSNADPFAVTLDGAWAVAYAGADERGLVFRAELREGTSKVNRGSIASPSLARPYYFTTTADGRLVSMHFSADVDGLARATLTSLATAFQVSRKRQPQWTTVESDSVGDYEARYTVVGSGLRRERMRYQRVVGDGAIEAAVLTTGTDIALRADGWPSSIAGTEVTRVGTEDLGVTVESKLSLRHRATASIDAGWHTGLEVAAVDAAAGHDPAQADRELVDGASLVDLLAEFEKVAGDSHARGHQFLRIAALLRLDAEAVRAAERAITDNAPAANVLVAALGEAGTPEAQRALGAVLESSLAEEPRTHAAIALGLTDAPTRATLDVLAAATRGGGDIGSSATLAQGNAALRIADEDPAAASRLVDDLLGRLARSSDDEETALVLRALGNTGDARIVPAVQRALASPSVIVRAAATEALRLVQAPVDALVIARLSDNASAVRSAAVFAAAQRDIGLYVTAFASALGKDGDVDVRRAIVELAGARIGEHAALRGIVEYAAEHDGDAELRAFAKQLLSVRS